MKHIQISLKPFLCSQVAHLSLSSSILMMPKKSLSLDAACSLYLCSVKIVRYFYFIYFIFFLFIIELYIFLHSPPYLSPTLLPTPMVSMLSIYSEDLVFFYFSCRLDPRMSVLGPSLLSRFCEIMNCRLLFLFFMSKTHL